MVTNKLTSHDNNLGRDPVTNAWPRCPPGFPFAVRPTTALTRPSVCPRGPRIR